MQSICYSCFQETVNEYGSCTACGYNNAKNREEYPLALPAGSILYGRYIVGRVLGQGGFGITYLAQDFQTKGFVAIKEFFPGAMATRTGTTVIPYSGVQGENFTYGRDTFLDEAKTMAQFNGHPNIAGVQLYFEENGTAYFVMEYLDGCSFDDYIKNRGGKLSWADTAKVMVPILDVLGQIHEKGIVHRDVSPDNIYITKDGTVKLLDFGAARHSLGNVSQSLDVVVKHGFAPKEQYSRRGRQGPYTDVYAASATIYYALTGVKPDESIDRIEEDTMPAPTILGAKISQPLENVLIKGLAVDAKDRYQTALELKNALTVMPNDGGGINIDRKKLFMIAGAALLACFALFWLLHPHKFDAWVTVKEATCEENGSKERKCFCGKKETAVINKTGHKEVIDYGYAATCTAEGLTDGIHCSACNKVLKQQTVTEKIPHKMVTKAAVSATCTKTGLTEGSVCENCDYKTGQITVASLGHSFSGNDCTRCSAKLWWVEFITTKRTFAAHERVDIDFKLCTNETATTKFTSSNGFDDGAIIATNLALIYPNFLKPKPTIKMYYRVDWVYPDGQNSTGKKQYFSNGEEIEADGTTWTIYWEDGCYPPGTATIYVYNDENYLLGSYTFTVK